MKTIISILLSLATLFPAAARIVLCDDNCKVEFSATTENEPRFAVVSPAGMPTVEIIQQAPRLTTLEGKTIAIVGESFMTNIIHPEIARLITQHYPTAKVLTIEDVGMAGVYPAPGVTRRSKDEFQAKLKQYGVDAVITGNCGCGLCTQKECGSAIAAEYIGIPAVVIAAPTFVEQVYYTATNNGVAALRVAEYPGAFALHTSEELITNTRNSLWDRIVTALTTPITDEEVKRHNPDTGRGITDDVYYGTTEQICAHFQEMKWSDGLPFILPTYERVSRFMEHTDFAPEQTVAVLPIAHRNTTA